MDHHMHLDNKNFYLIAIANKCIEIRLYDDKRKSIHVGDKVLFESGSGGHMMCNVTGLHIFATFKKLFESLDSQRLGYAPGQNADYHDMYNYYTMEDELTTGVIGIELEVLRSDGSTVPWPKNIPIMDVR